MKNDFKKVFYEKKTLRSPRSASKTLSLDQPLFHIHTTLYLSASHTFIFSFHKCDIRVMKLISILVRPFWTAFLYGDFLSTIVLIGNHEKGMKNVFCASKNHIPREKMSKFSHLLTVSLTVKYSGFFRLLLHFSEFLILHSIFQDNLTERTIVLWTTFLISIACLVSILHRSAGGKKVNMIIS